MNTTSSALRFRCCSQFLIDIDNIFTELGTTLELKVHWKLNLIFTMLDKKTNASLTVHSRLYSTYKYIISQCRRFRA